MRRILSAMALGVALAAVSASAGEHGGPRGLGSRPTPTESASPAAGTSSPSYSMRQVVSAIGRLRLRPGHDDLARPSAPPRPAE